MPEEPQNPSSAPTTGMFQPGQVKSHLDALPPLPSSTMPDSIPTPQNHQDFRLLMERTAALTYSVLHHQRQFDDKTDVQKFAIGFGCGIRFLGDLFAHLAAEPAQASLNAGQLANLFRNLIRDPNAAPTHEQAPPP